MKHSTNDNWHQAAGSISSSHVAMTRRLKRQ